MIDLLFPIALIVPEIGSAASSAFKSWAGDVARDMVGQAVHEAVSQTKSSLPFFLQGAVDAVSGDLTPRIKKMASKTAETILAQRLAGYALVPLAMYEAQQKVVDAARTGNNLQDSLAALDALNTAALHDKKV